MSIEPSPLCGDVLNKRDLGEVKKVGSYSFPNALFHSGVSTSHLCFCEVRFDQVAARYLPAKSALCFLAEINELQFSIKPERGNADVVLKVTTVVATETGSCLALFAMMLSQHRRVQHQATSFMHCQVCPHGSSTHTLYSTVALQHHAKQNVLLSDKTTALLWFAHYT